MKTRTRKPQENYDFIILDGKRIEPNQRLTVSQLIAVCKMAKSGHMELKGVECMSRIGEHHALFIPATVDDILTAINEDIEEPDKVKSKTNAYFTFGFEYLYIE